MSARVGLVAGVLLLATAGCGGRATPPAASPPPSATSAPPSVTTPPPEPPPTSTPATPRRPRSHTATPSSEPRPAVTKLLVVVVENHSLDQMRTQMPYTFGLAQRFGYATGYRAITHPSLPNYLAIVGGQTYGVADDGPPSAHPVPGPSVFGQALARHHTAAVYADGMSGTCATGDQGSYRVKHNAWAYFVDERQACAAHDRPYGELAGVIARGDLPDAGMVVPDICHDAHDCGLSVADDWFRGLMRQVFAGPDWRSGHLAVVLTADEDDDHHGNAVLTVVVHPSQHHHVVAQPLDHYSLTRLYDDVVHAPHLHRAASAPSLSQAFGLPVG